MIYTIVSSIATEAWTSRPQSSCFILGNRPVLEGLGKIRSKFASVEHVGPGWVADFLEMTEKEDREIITRRVYEKVNELLDMLRVSSSEERG